MKKYIFLFFAVCAFSVYANAQNRTGDCTSYTSDDRSVTFYLNDSSAIQLRLCSQSTVRIWFSPDGSFQRNNPSFAVVNEDLEDVGTVHVDEQNACYEIFTPKLRIRVNKSPFNLQIFDKYQKLLFSDYADKGHISNGQRKLEYKTLRRDEHFFGLGEKTGKLDRRGEAYKMWNSDKPCYSAVEDPLYKSIPFFMSSYRYGIFLDNTYKTEFKFGTESRDYYSFEAPGGEMIYYFIFGKDYKEIMKQYVDLTGKHTVKAVVIPDGGQDRGICRESDGRKRAALVMKSPDKFRSDVLRVCSAASIAADEDLVTGAQGFFADLRHIFDDRIESAALFQCFLMVIEAFFYECSHFFSSP